MKSRDIFKRSGIRTLMSGMLIILAAAAAAAQGLDRTWIQLLPAPVSAVLAETILRRFTGRAHRSLTSALITGLIIALVLQPGISWHIAVFASLAAIGSKYVLKFDGRHIFNPANLGLAMTGILFGTPFFWWGAENTILVIILGTLIAARYRRLHLVFSFLAVQYTILGLYFGSLRSAAIMTNYFFVFVMLVEPKTSPIKKAGRVLYGAAAAAAASVLIIAAPQYDPWVISLIAANILTPVINRKFSLQNSNASR